MKSRAAAPLARANRLPAAARAHARWPCNPPTPPPSLKPCRPASAPPRGRPWPPTRPAAPPPPRATPPTAPPALKPFDPAPAHITAAPLYRRGTHRRRRQRLRLLILEINRRAADVAETIALNIPRHRRPCHAGGVGDAAGSSIWHFDRGFMAAAAGAEL